MVDYLPSHSETASFLELGHGGPTILALARLAGESWSTDRGCEIDVGDLSPHARAILSLACERGVLEVRGSNKAFEASDRLLTVFVQQAADQWIRFRRSTDVRETVRYLEGFRQLCAAGLVVHHLYHEFSLTERGFALSDHVDVADIQLQLAYGEPCSWGG